MSFAASSIYSFCSGSSLKFTPQVLGHVCKAARLGSKGSNVSTRLILPPLLGTTRRSISDQGKPLGHVKDDWQIHKEALARKFKGEQWAPRKRLSPDALGRIRRLHAQDPELYTTEELSRHFEISPDAIRRILKSKWRPSETEEGDRQRRWERRGERIWSALAETGMKVPRRWRRSVYNKEGVDDDGRTFVHRSKPPRDSAPHVKIHETWSSTPTTARGEGSSQSSRPTDAALSDKLL